MTPDPITHRWLIRSRIAEWFLAGMTGILGAVVVGWFYVALVVS